MEVLLTGIVFGLAVAAPVGPIGLLCIRRTLAEGRGAGLAAGLGAATADGLYGVMVAAGFGATGLLLRYETALQIFGGGLIALLGLLSLRAFLRAGADGAAAPAPAPGGAGRIFATTFVLTLSNPATILTFIGLMAGLGAAAAGDATAAFRLVAGVFLGSALWWLILVHLSLAARTQLTSTSTRWIDLISGLLLFGWGMAIVARPALGLE